MLLIELRAPKADESSERLSIKRILSGPQAGGRSYLDNGYRIDERRTGDSSRVKEEKGDENHRENHRAAEGDLEIREDSNGEELADCKLYSPARRDCGKIGRADEIIIVRVPSPALSLFVRAFSERKGEGRRINRAMPIAT